MKTVISTLLVSSFLLFSGWWSCDNPSSPEVEAPTITNCSKHADDYTSAAVEKALRNMYDQAESEARSKSQDEYGKIHRQNEMFCWKKAARACSDITGTGVISIDKTVQMGFPSWTFITKKEAGECNKD